MLEEMYILWLKILWYKDWVLFSLGYIYNTVHQTYYYKKIVNDFGKDKAIAHLIKKYPRQTFYESKEVAEVVHETIVSFEAIKISIVYCLCRLDERQWINKNITTNKKG